MTEEILTVVISLLAVYGLCGLCMRIVTWLTCTKTEKSFAVIPITDLSQLTDRIMWAKLKFEPFFGKKTKSGRLMAAAMGRGRRGIGRHASVFDAPSSKVRNALSKSSHVRQAMMSARSCFEPSICRT